MSLPTLDLTWRSNINQTVTATGTAIGTNRKVIRQIKDSLISGTGWNTAPSSLWTVRYSSDSTGPGTGTAGDGVDHWTTDGALVWQAPASAHSWIVLRQTGIGSTFEMCIALESAAPNGNVVAIIFSPSATFTGGTTTARPTATDEVVLLASGTGFLNATDATVRTHVLMSSDGKSTAIVTARAGVLNNVLLIALPKSPVSGWSNPFWAWSQQSPVALDAATLTTIGVQIKSRAASATMTLFMTGEASSGAQLTSTFTGPNDLSVESPMLPIGLASTTASATGRHGVVYDMWWGIQTYANADTYPGDASRQFVQIGDVIFPNPTGVAWALT